MTLYTERHGMRKPTMRTYTITIEMYELLLDCCKKYYKNLTHLFPQNCHHDFTAKDYLTFNERQFNSRLKIKIPTLFRDEYDKISSPMDSDKYDQYALLDLIEFIAQNANDISEEWNNQRYKDYRHIECFATSNVFEDYQREINEILIECGLLYILTPSKVVERVQEYSIITHEIEEAIIKIEDKGTRELLSDAIALFNMPHPYEHREAVEKIWDALESLKTHFPGIGKNQNEEKLARILSNSQSEVETIFKKDLSDLGNIGNNFSIRHFNDKQVKINDGRHYDYFFKRCLTLITTALQYIVKEETEC